MAQSDNLSNCIYTAPRVRDDPTMSKFRIDVGDLVVHTKYGVCRVLGVEPEYWDPNNICIAEGAVETESIDVFASGVKKYWVPPSSLRPWAAADAKPRPPWREGMKQGKPVINKDDELEIPLVDSSVRRNMEDAADPGSATHVYASHV